MQEAARIIGSGLATTGLIGAEIGIGLSKCKKIKDKRIIRKLKIKQKSQKKLASQGKGFKWWKLLVSLLGIFLVYFSILAVIYDCLATTGSIWALVVIFFVSILINQVNFFIKKIVEY